MVTLNKPKTKTPSMGIDLGNLLSAQTQQTEKVTARQTEELESAARKQQITGKARRDALAVNDQARADAETTRQEQLEILNGLGGQLDKARTAIALSDSDNPMDRLHLWFLQQQDPGYTREGNLARIGYLNEAANAVGNVGTIQQAGYADQISRMQEVMDMQLESDDDRLELLSIAEKQGQELIDAEVANHATRLGVMQNQQSMQTQAMVNMTDDQIGVALANAAKAPNQSVNVGGVDVSLAQLQARQSQITERRYNESVMQNNMADQVIMNLTAEQLQELHSEAIGSKKRTAVVDGISVPAGRIEDRIYALNDRDLQQQAQKLQMTNINESLVTKAQQHILDGMEMPEIEALIQNGFRDENGIKYDSTAVRAARDSKYNDNQKSALDAAMVGGMLTPVSAAADKSQYVDSVIQNLPANSPALSGLNMTKQSLALSATLLNSGDAAQIELGTKMLAAADESIRAQVDAEAKRLSHGDKDMEMAYQYTLTGQTIPEDLVRNTLTTRVKKGQPVGRWLTGDQNAIFVQSYRGEKYRLEQESQMQGGFGMDKEDVESAAAEFAVNQVLNSIAAPMSDQIMLMQANTPGNPIHGVVSTNEFAAMLSNADRQGIDAWIAANQPNKETEARIRAGAEIPQGLESAQNARLYMALERKKPGLGDAYVDWWGSEKRAQMVDTFMQSKKVESSNDFTKMSQFSLIQPQLNPALGNYANTLAQGKQDVYAAEIQAEHVQYITFGGNPQAKQVFLLEQTPNLTTQEKQIGMQDVIQPIIDLGKASGYTNPDDLTKFVETQLRSYEPSTPQARTVHRKIMAGRDAALKVIDDFISVNSGGNYSVFGSAGPIATQRTMQEIDNQTSLPWYQDMLKGNLAPAAPPPNRGMQ